MRLLNQTRAKMRVAVTRKNGNHDAKPPACYAVEETDGTWCVVEITVVRAGKGGERLCRRRTIVATHETEREAEVDARGRLGS